MMLEREVAGLKTALSQINDFSPPVSTIMCDLVFLRLLFVWDGEEKFINTGQIRRRKRRRWRRGRRKTTGSECVREGEGSECVREGEGSEGVRDGFSFPMPVFPSVDGARGPDL